MNKRIIAYSMGILLLTEGLLMILPMAVGIIDKDGSALSFLYVIIPLLIAGFITLKHRPKNKKIYAKEGFVIVSLGWIIISIVGAIPFILSGSIPNFVDAVFETVSGFTTTGSSILTDVESLPRSILFWRSFTHWIGGMGVLVFILSALSLAGGGGNIHIMRAESPGHEVSKLVPSSRGTAKILYITYLVLTVVEILLLLLGKVPLFDALTLSFGTAGTGGFAIKNDSIASYSVYAQTVITIFMMLFGINFGCYFLLLKGKVKEFFSNEELKGYIIILFSAIILITINTNFMYPSVIEAFRTASFQAASVMTTTGYATVNFDVWPEMSRMIMIMIMCVGACSGSTGGGIKVSRIMIMMKGAIQETRKFMRPNTVSTVSYNGKPIDDEMIKSVSTFFIVYMMVFVISVLLVSIDTKDTISNISGVIATLNNIGPGLGIVGAAGNYSTYSAFSKLVFIADMLFGRLELFPMIILFSLRTWKK